MSEPSEELKAAWRENAILRHPGSEKLSEMVTGSTREEVEASAATAAARVSEIAGGTGDTLDQVRQAYGPGPSIGGSTGTTTPMGYASPETRESRWQIDFADRFNNALRDTYGQRLGISPKDVERYTSGRFIEHVIGRLNMWAGMTRSDSGYRRPQPPR